MPEAFNSRIEQAGDPDGSDDVRPGSPLEDVPGLHLGNSDPARYFGGADPARAGDGFQDGRRVGVHDVMYTPYQRECQQLFCRLQRFLGRDIEVLQMPTFGESLRRARVAAGKSQEDVARALSVSKETVSRWEREEQPPVLDNAMAVCTLLGIDARDFMPRVGAPAVRDVGRGYQADAVATPKERAVVQIHRKIVELKVQQEIDEIVLNVLRVYYRAKGLEERDIDGWRKVLLRAG